MKQKNKNKNALKCCTRLPNFKLICKLTATELESHKEPYYYICQSVNQIHRLLLYVRIVFNSSAKYMGHVLNDYWASLLQILMWFRENKIGCLGDICKMYHTMHTSELEQHTHHFLWRNMETKRKPDIYVKQKKKLFWKMLE